MTQTEQDVRAAVAAAVSKLTPLPDGSYSPEQLQRAVKAACAQCADALAACHTQASSQDASCAIDAVHSCRYALLAYEDARVSAWLLGWPGENPGTEIHDHGDSHAAVAVTSGTVKETLYTPNGTRTVRNLPAGECVRIPREYIHKFEDADHAGSEGLSLHLYSPPLRRMGYYGYRPDGSFARTGGWDADAQAA
jgi:hypothetical protein